MKKYLDIMRNPMVDVVCNEEDLELGKYPVPQIPVSNCLQNIGSNPITYKDEFLLRQKGLPLERQIKYV